jgi:hypothetical protein
VRDVRFVNVKTSTVKADARPAMVFIDAQDVTPPVAVAEAATH